MQIPCSDFQDQLVRGLAHKLNNILSLFHGYLGMLLEIPRLDENTRNGLIRIQEGADAATEILERTRTLARPTSIIWRSVRLSEFFAAHKVVFEQALVHTGSLTIDCPEELPLISTDVSRLRTIIYELIRNASEATENGAPVRVTVRFEQPSGNRRQGVRRSPERIVISIHDRGHGIAPEIAERICQPFFTTRHNRDADGLGLTLAVGIAQQIGGTLDFESKPGNTVFRLALPLNPSAA